LRKARRADSFSSAGLEESVIHFSSAVTGVRDFSDLGGGGSGKGPFGSDLITRIKLPVLTLAGWFSYFFLQKGKRTSSIQVSRPLHQHNWFDIIP
jgi:hypothetical protein